MVEDDDGDVADEDFTFTVRSRPTRIDFPINLSIPFLWIAGGFQNVIASTLTVFASGNISYVLSQNAVFTSEALDDLEIDIGSLTVTDVESGTWSPSISSSLVTFFNNYLLQGTGNFMSVSIAFRRPAHQTLSGFDYTLAAAQPIANAPALGTMGGLGIVGKETFPALVTGIQGHNDLSADVFLVPLGNEIHGAETGPIPAYDPRITLPEGLIARPFAGRMLTGYTIVGNEIVLTYADGSMDEFTFDLSGISIENVEQLPDDSIQITFSDGTILTIPAGQAGRGIMSVERVDDGSGRVIVTYDDGTTQVFIVSDGSDGSGFELVFRRTASLSDVPGAITSTAQGLVTDQYEPAGWARDPISPTADERIVWAAIRTGTTGNWSEFVHPPALFAQWGIDGASVEFVYRRTSTDSRPANITTTDAEKLLNDFIPTTPTGITDELDDVSVDFPYRWISKRKRVTGSNAWEEFSPWALDATFSQDGLSVTGSGSAIFIRNGEEPVEDQEFNIRWIRRGVTEGRVRVTLGLNDDDEIVGTFSNRSSGVSTSSSPSSPAASRIFTATFEDVPATVIGRFQDVSNIMADMRGQGWFRISINASQQIILEDLADTDPLPAAFVTLANEATPGDNRTGDFVTFYRSGFSQSWFWTPTPDPGSWLRAAAVLGAELIVGLEAFFIELTAGDAFIDSLTANVAFIDDLRANVQNVVVLWTGSTEVDDINVIYQFPMNTNIDVFDYLETVGQVTSGSPLFCALAAIPVDLIRTGNNSSRPSNAVGWSLIAGSESTNTALFYVWRSSDGITLYMQPEDNDEDAIFYAITGISQPGSTPTPTPTNQDPIARAGSDQSVTEGSSVSLDGSNSSDPDGSIASYEWSKVSGPSSPTISNATSAVASITPTVAGTYVYRLTVTDDDGATDDDDVRITVTSASARELVVSHTSVSVIEGDATGQIVDVRLTSAPTGNVTVAVQGITSSEINVSPTSLTFTISNWNDNKQIRITGVQDADTSDETNTITLNPSGGGYNNASSVNIAVSVEDDDEPPVDEDEAPNVPRNVSIRDVTSSSYTFNWEAPFDWGYPTTTRGFETRRRSHSGDGNYGGWSGWISRAFTLTQITSNAISGRTYQASIRSFNVDSNGNRSYSDIITDTETIP